MEGSQPLTPSFSGERIQESPVCLHTDLLFRLSRQVAASLVFYLIKEESQKTTTWERFRNSSRSPCPVLLAFLFMPDYFRNGIGIPTLACVVQPDQLLRARSVGKL